MNDKPGIWQSWPRAAGAMALFYLVGTLLLLGIWKAVELLQELLG